MVRKKECNHCGTNYKFDEFTKSIDSIQVQLYKITNYKKNTIQIRNYKVNKYLQRNYQDEAEGSSWKLKVNLLNSSIHSWFAGEIVSCKRWSERSQSLMHTKASTISCCNAFLRSSSIRPLYWMLVRLQQWRLGLKKYPLPVVLGSAKLMLVPSTTQPNQTPHYCLQLSPHSGTPLTRWIRRHLLMKIHFHSQILLDLESSSSSSSSS